MIEILTPNPIEDGVGEKPPCPRRPGDLAGVCGQVENGSSRRKAAHNAAVSAHRARGDPVTIRYAVSMEEVVTARYPLTIR
jgi:hypothetical protein